MENHDFKTQELVLAVLLKLNSVELKSITPITRFRSEFTFASAPKHLLDSYIRGTAEVNLREAINTYRHLTREARDAQRALEGGQDTCQ